MNLAGTQVVLATGNAGKLKEFAGLLAPLEITLITQASLDIASAPEPYETFIENALTKARHTSRASGLASLADDSGICVECLYGAPGIHSARFAGAGASDAMNNQHLMAQMQGQSNRRAKYVCVLVFIRHPSDPEPIIAVGNWHGEVLDHPRGTGGFGYDPYFYIPELGKTAAELDLEQKNALSHRAIAAHELIKRLQHA